MMGHPHRPHHHTLCMPHHTQAPLPSTHRRTPCLAPLSSSLVYMCRLPYLFFFHPFSSYGGPSNPGGGCQTRHHTPLFLPCSPNHSLVVGYIVGIIHAGKVYNKKAPQGT